MNSRNFHEIEVDLEYPECNREAIVYELEGIPGVGSEKGKEYKGYWICTPIDIRFILDDETTPLWKAQVYSDNEVLLSLQAWDYSHLNDRDEFVPSVSENVVDALDSTHHDLATSSDAAKEARKWKYLKLKFKGNVKLSSKVINREAGDDENLKLELIPIEVKHKRTETTYVSLYAAWKVARLDVKARKKGKVEKKEDKSDAAILLDKLRNRAAAKGGTAKTNSTKNRRSTNNTATNTTKSAHTRPDAVFSDVSPQVPISDTFDNPIPEVNSFESAVESESAYTEESVGSMSDCMSDVLFTEEPNMSDSEDFDDMIDDAISSVTKGIFEGKETLKQTARKNKRSLAESNKPGLSNEGLLKFAGNLKINGVVPPTN